MPQVGPLNRGGVPPLLPVLLGAFLGEFWNMFHFFCKTKSTRQCISHSCARGTTIYSRADDALKAMLMRTTMGHVMLVCNTS